MNDSHPNDKTSYVVKRKFLWFYVPRTFDTFTQAATWMADGDKMYRVTEMIGK